MRRQRKRLWTALIVFGSSILILAAVAVGTVRLFDLISPKYRIQLAERAAEFIERPVKIGRLDFEWQGFNPALVLGEMSVLTEDRRALIFSAEEFSVAASWSALLRGEVRPSSVTLRGLTLGLEWRTDGRLGIRDIDGAPLVIDFAEIARWTERIQRVRVEDTRLEWSEPGAKRPQVITGVQMELAHAGQRYRLKGQATLPKAWGESLQFSLRAEGDMAAFEQMSMQGEAQVTRLRPQPWLAPFVRRNLRIEGAATDAEADFSLRGFELTRARLNFTTAPARIIRKKTAERVGDLPGPSGEFEISNRVDGWQLALHRLSYGTGVQTQGQLDYRETPAKGTRLLLELDRIDFAALAGWTSVLSVAKGLDLPTAGVSGELRELLVEHHQPAGAEASFRMQAELGDLTMPPAGARPGFTRLGGRVEANSTGGEVLLNVQQGSAEIPAVFDVPLLIDRLSGRIAWAPVPDGWEVKGEEIALQSRSLQVATGFTVRIPADEGSPYMSLRGDFTGLAPDAKHYIPHPPVLEQEVGDWLRAAIMDGQARNGRVEIEGPLADFPFVDQHNKASAEHHFLVALDAENATLQYGPGWPRLDKINGHLRIAGNTLTIEAPTAEILGAAVGPARVVIPDFRKPILIVDGTANTDIRTQLSFLGESPLKAMYGPLVKAIAAQGPASLALHIDLPLGDIEQYQVDGRVQLSGVTLRYGGLEAPITQLRGALAFDNNGLHADTLDAKLFGLPLSARLTPAREGGRTGARLEADMAVQLPRDAQALSSLVPSVWLSPLKGDSRWQLSGVIHTQAAPTEFRLLSDLVGTEIALGPPFGKRADRAMPAEITYLPESSGFEFRTRLGSVLRTRFAFKSQGSGAPQVFERGILQLGDGDTPPLPTGQGLWLAGSLPELDLDASRRYLVALGTGATAEGTPESTSTNAQLRGGQLQLGVLRFGGQQFRDTRIQLTPMATGWNMAFSGTDVLGSLAWNAQGRGALNGEFERLVFTAPAATEDDAAEEPRDKRPFDPAVLPGLRLHSKALLLGTYELGEATFEAAPIKDGIRLQQIELGGRKLRITGNGEWLRSSGASTAALKLGISGSDLKGLLGAVGYAESVTTEEAEIEADVHWTPHVDGLTNRTLNGQLSARLKNGALLAVDPGAGRVVSLLSFSALPRRLALDFSDVTEKGTQFDTLEGNFIIREGVAHTDDLKVKSPAVTIKVKGDVNFATRSYDQIVTIKPKLSSGVALAGAALAGPVIGIAIFLAQSVLDQPVEDIATFTYRLGGSFKEPDIQPVKLVRRKTPKSPEQGTSPGTEGAADGPAPGDARDIAPGRPE